MFWKPGPTDTTHPTHIPHIPHIPPRLPNNTWQEPDKKTNCVKPIMLRSLAVSLEIGRIFSLPPRCEPLETRGIKYPVGSSILSPWLPCPALPLAQLDPQPAPRVGFALAARFPLLGRLSNANSKTGETNLNEICAVLPSLPPSFLSWNCNGGLTNTGYDHNDIPI